MLFRFLDYLGSLPVVKAWDAEPTIARKVLSVTNLTWSICLALGLYFAGMLWLVARTIVRIFLQIWGITWDPSWITKGSLSFANPIFTTIVPFLTWKLLISALLILSGVLLFSSSFRRVIIWQLQTKKVKMVLGLLALFGCLCYKTKYPLALYSETHTDRFLESLRALPQAPFIAAAASFLIWIEGWTLDGLRIAYGWTTSFVAAYWLLSNPTYAFMNHGEAFYNMAENHWLKTNPELTTVIASYMLLLAGIAAWEMVSYLFYICFQRLRDFIVAVLAQRHLRIPQGQQVQQQMPPPVNAQANAAPAADIPQLPPHPAAEAPPPPSPNMQEVLDRPVRRDSQDWNNEGPALNHEEPAPRTIFERVQDWINDMGFAFRAGTNAIVAFFFAAFGALYIIINHILGWWRLPPYLIFFVVSVGFILLATCAMVIGGGLIFSRSLDYNIKNWSVHMVFAALARTTDVIWKEIKRFFQAEVRSHIDKMWRNLYQSVTGASQTSGKSVLENLSKEVLKESRLKYQRDYPYYQPRHREAATEQDARQAYVQGRTTMPSPEELSFRGEPISTNDWSESYSQSNTKTGPWYTGVIPVADGVKKNDHHTEKSTEQESQDAEFSTQVDHEFHMYTSTVPGSTSKSSSGKKSPGISSEAGQGQQKKMSSSTSTSSSSEKESLTEAGEEQRGYAKDTTTASSRGWFERKPAVETAEKSPKEEFSSQTEKEQQCSAKDSTTASSRSWFARKPTVETAEKSSKEESSSQIEKDQLSSKKAASNISSESLNKKASKPSTKSAEKSPKEASSPETTDAYSGDGRLNFPGLENQAGSLVDQTFGSPVGTGNTISGLLSCQAQSCVSSFPITYGGVLSFVFMAWIISRTIQRLRKNSGLARLIGSVLWWKPIRWLPFFLLGYFGIRLPHFIAPTTFLDMFSDSSDAPRYAKIAIFCWLLSFKLLKPIVHAVTYNLWTQPLEPKCNPNYLPSDVTVIIRAGRFDPITLAAVVDNILSSGCAQVIVATAGVDRYQMAVMALGPKLAGVTFAAGSQPFLRICNVRKDENNVRTLLLTTLDKVHTPLVAVVDGIIPWGQQNTGTIVTPETFLTSAIRPFEDPMVAMVSIPKLVVRNESNNRISKWANYYACVTSDIKKVHNIATQALDGGVAETFGGLNSVNFYLTESLHSTNFRFGYATEKCSASQKGVSIEGGENYAAELFDRMNMKVVVNSDPNAVLEVQSPPATTYRWYDRGLEECRVSFRHVISTLVRDRVIWTLHPWTAYSSFLYFLLDIPLLYDLALIYLYRSANIGSLCWFFNGWFVMQIVQQLPYLLRHGGGSFWSTCWKEGGGILFAAFMSYWEGFWKLHAIFTLDELVQIGRGDSLYYLY